MGFFDRFTRKAKPRNPALTCEGGARRHHYLFAHRALRDLVHEDPVRALTVLHSPDASDFLNRVWNGVGEFCQQHGEQVLPADGLACEPLRVGTHPSVLVRLPRATGAVEAILIGIVLQVTPGEQPPRVAYFTLELGRNAQGQAYTVLCQWSGEMHVNFGVRCEPEPAAFAKLIAGVLSGEITPAASVRPPAG